MIRAKAWTKREDHARWRTTTADVCRYDAIWRLWWWSACTNHTTKVADNTFHLCPLCACLMTLWQNAQKPQVLVQDRVLLQTLQLYKQIGYHVACRTKLGQMYLGCRHWCHRCQLPGSDRMPGSVCRRSYTNRQCRPWPLSRTTEESASKQITE